MITEQDVQRRLLDLTNQHRDPRKLLVALTDYRRAVTEGARRVSIGALSMIDVAISCVEVRIEPARAPLVPLI